MKTRFLFVAAALFLGTVFSSCHHDDYYHNHDDVSFSIHEDDDEYRLNAKFDESKTREIDSYIKTCMGSDGHYRYNGQGDFNATLTLDDNSQVYIRSREGRLKIKFDKEANTAEACEKIRDMCEGIKEMLEEDN